MRVILAVSLLLLALPASSLQTSVRSYDVPGAGTLELEVPMRWQEEIGWTADDHRPLLKFRPDEGEAFLLSITVMTRPEDAPADFGSVEWTRAVAEGAARRSLGIDAEQHLGLEQIGDAQVVGWYYSVTDAQLPDPPPPGTYRVMTQGVSAAGPVVLTATLLTQRSWGEEVNEGMRILRGARLTDRPADSWRVPSQAVRLRAGIGERYDLDIPEDFELRSRSPLELRCRQSGGLLRIDARPVSSRSSVKSELLGLEAEIERRSPGSWITRQRGHALLGGKAAARLIVLDELRDQAVTFHALPLSDIVLQVTWTVHPTMERTGAQRLHALLQGFRLR